jgi:hypothetical protein
LGVLYHPRHSGRPAPRWGGGGLSRQKKKKDVYTRGSVVGQTIILQNYTWFGLPPWRKRDLRCPRILHSVKQDKNSSWTAGPLKVEPVIFPETSVLNCRSTLGNIPQERRYKIMLFPRQNIQVSLLSCPRARQLYRIDTLHPPGLIEENCECCGKRSAETIGKFLSENGNRTRLDY